MCRSRAPASRGFTLVELLLVLTLLAAAAGIVAPRLTQWIDGARERAALDALRSAFAALPERAFFSGQAIELPAEPRAGDAGLPLPEGWALRLDAPLRYESNGMTAGARVEVRSPDRVVAQWRVLPPAGRVQGEEAGR
jgi:prepilin-type N-terminal cleavage/methylation domain-containing protein